MPLRTRPPSALAAPDLGASSGEPRAEPAVGPSPEPADHLASDAAAGGTVATRPSRRTGRVLTVVVCLAGAVAAWRLRGTLGDAAVALGRLDGPTIAAVGACWVAMVLCRAAVYRWAHRGSTLGQGLVLDQVNLAAGNGLPGGVVVGYAVRYRVGRSFGQTPDGITLTVFTASQAFSLGRWLLVAGVVGTTVVRGAGTRIDQVVLTSAVVALAGGAVLWAVLAHDTRASRWAVRRAQGVLDGLGRRVGRVRDVPVVPFVDGLRLGARWVLRERSTRLLVCGAAAGLAAAGIVVAVVQGLEGAEAPGTWEILRAYLLARVACAFVPTPGGVGALDGALGAGLVAAGAEPGAAVAAVLVYRGLTFALPIATGAATYLGWRRWDRRRSGWGGRDGTMAGRGRGGRATLARGTPCSTSATPTGSAPSPSTGPTP